MQRGLRGALLRYPDGNINHGPLNLSGVTGQSGNYERASRHREEWQVGGRWAERFFSIQAGESMG